MNVLITGSNGQLGQALKMQVCLQKNINNFLYTDFNELDITKPEDLDIFCKKNNINFIINCAAYTAVDKAESETKLAYNINSKAVLNIANTCKKFDIPLIHISTDFVFDGSQLIPYIEDSKTNPLSVYAKSKFEGEEYVNQVAPTYAIVRTSWLYSEFGNNFLKTVLRLASERKELKIVRDQIGTPTYARDLADVVLKLLDKLSSGTREIFHYSNDGDVSWFDFAKEILYLAGIDTKVLPISSSEFYTAAKRPSYSVMDKNKIKKYLEIEIPFWKESLKRCMEEI